MLDAGKLRHRLKILYNDSSQDTITGEDVEGWVELATIWGSWEPYSTKDMIAAASVQNETSVRAMVRYRSDITAGMRVYFRSKYYEIAGTPLPDLDSGLEYMTIMLAEVLNA